MKFKIEVDTEAKKITAEGFTVERKSTWYSRFFSTAAANIAPSPEPKQPKPGTEPLSETKPRDQEIIVKSVLAPYPLGNIEDVAAMVKIAMATGYRAGRRHKKPVVFIMNQSGEMIREITLPRQKS